METTKEKNHALSNCRGQLETIKELYRNYQEAESNDDYEAQDAIREEALNDALSVEFRSGWSANSEDMKAEEFKILLSWGGPACQIIGKLDEHQQPEDVEIEYQDWGTPWTRYEVSYNHNDYSALLWYCEQFYFGE